MEQHQVEYMKRNYPTDWQTREMTSYDAKMAHMVNKIREKYKHVYETRPHTILIEQKALVQQAPQQVEVPKKKTPEDVNVKTVQPAKATANEPVAEGICQAITITTNKVCGRKAKFGGFCGLHCKK
jgi:hypothetical protein